MQQRFESVRTGKFPVTPASRGDHLVLLGWNDTVGGGPPNVRHTAGWLPPRALWLPPHTLNSFGGSQVLPASLLRHAVRAEV